MELVISRLFLEDDNNSQILFRLPLKIHLEIGDEIIFVNDGKIIYNKGFTLTKLVILIIKECKLEGEKS